MGLSSTSARLLQLTSRKSSIGLELARIANQKMSLTREMRKLSTVYNEALTNKVLKWSNNSGVSYYDLSYSNLMQPSPMNNNTAFLITDSSGKVVADNKYLKYAEMISPNGGKGDWEGNRTAILSELLGISSSTIDAATASADLVAKRKAALAEVESRKPKTTGFKNTSEICCLLEKLGSSTGCSNGFKGADDWADAYQHGGTINLGSSNPTGALESIGKKVAGGLSKYLVNESSGFSSAESPIHEGVASAVNMYSSVIENANITEKSNGVISKDGDNFILNVAEFIDAIILESGINTYEQGNSYSLDWYDLSSGAYTTYINDTEKWKNEYAAAKAQYDSAVDSDNMLLTAEQEKQIAFYDDIFSAIAEKGWVYNESVQDNDYLNQMLQNNIYTITTVGEQQVIDESGFTYTKNSYDTNIAANVTNIFSVNDKYARENAQVAYEAEKARINEKESRLDIRMKTLETEQTSINTMIESLKNIKDENIESTFDIFT